MKIHNWSKYPVVDVNYSSFDLPKEISLDAEQIARGMGRCYGDSSLNGKIISSLKHNKALAFDKENGIFTCQAGMTIDQVLQVIVPQGWFVPVTPGTKFITIGGAIASDVHGKNHHYEGSFGHHVISFEMLLATGEIITVTPQNKELFETTCGGMGLTGVILQATFKLKKIESSYIKQRSIKVKNLDEMISLFEENKDTTYSVSWIDCLQKGKHKGRGLLNLGEHANLEQLDEKQKVSPLITHPDSKTAFPIDLPSFAINKLTVKSFNFAYYHKQQQKIKEFISHYEPFFYPLDAILEWNKVYGKNGFLQYQFVLPLETSREGLDVILDKISDFGMSSPLVVLKLFGKQNDFISFPMEGYTLALDFPIKNGLFEFLDELDVIVHDLGGRLYLTKDARMTGATFLKGYSNAEEFIQRIGKYNPDYTFQSLQSKRLNITK